MKLFKYVLCLHIILFNIGCKQNADLLIPDSDNGGLILPDGFSAFIVVDSVGPSRHIAVNNNGDIYVKLRVATGKLGNIALRDTSRDGRVDIVKRFGNYPNDGAFATEMRIHKGYLYFSSELVIYRQKLDENLIPQSECEILVRDKYPIRWHNAKSLAFDNEGGMYVTFGAPTNVCEDWSTVPGESSTGIKGYYPCPQLRDHAGIWRFDEAKENQWQSDGELYATGIRSVVGISWNEEVDKLFALQHGRDYLHGHAPNHFSKWQNAILPAEEFVQVNKGDNFGWPYSYYDHFKGKRMLAPEYDGDGNISVNEYKEPLMGLPAHWAPNDLLFYRGSQFPERYKNGAFIAFHGSTNRSPYPQGGYIVAFIPMKNGKPTGQWEVFVDGFAQVETIKTKDDAKFRPMGLAEGPDGSLYISESTRGKIWRVVYHGEGSGFGEKQLKKMELLKSKSYLREPKESDTLIVENK